MYFVVGKFTLKRSKCSGEVLGREAVKSCVGKISPSNVKFASEFFVDPRP